MAIDRISSLVCGSCEALILPKYDCGRVETGKTAGDSENG